MIANLLDHQNFINTRCEYIPSICRNTGDVNSLGRYHSKSNENPGKIRFLVHLLVAKKWLNLGILRRRPQKPGPCDIVNVENPILYKDHKRGPRFIVCSPSPTASHLWNCTCRTKTSCLFPLCMYVVLIL